MRQRDASVSIKLDTTEHAQLHALANDGDEHIGRMFRRWLRERYVARFGDAAPPPVVIKMGRPRAMSAPRNGE